MNVIFTAFLLGDPLAVEHGKHPHLFAAFLEVFERLVCDVEAARDVQAHKVMTDP